MMINSIVRKLCNLKHEKKLMKQAFRGDVVSVMLLGRSVYELSSDQINHP